MPCKAARIGVIVGSVFTLCMLGMGIFFLLWQPETLEEIKQAAAAGRRLRTLPPQMRAPTTVSKEQPL